MIQWQKIIVSRMCIIYCAMPLGRNKMICVAQPVFLFCSERQTLYIPYGVGVANEVHVLNSV